MWRGVTGLKGAAVKDYCCAVDLFSWGVAMSALDIQRTIDDVETREPERSADRDFTCPVCGQVVDRQDLAQMDYHTDQPHAPQD
jgi:hypothetical protein